MVRRLSESLFGTEEAIDFGLAQDDFPGIPNYGDRANDLMDFGKSLNEGKVHIGVVWGLEYGWILRKYPRLQIIVVASQGVGGHQKASWPIELYAHPTSKARSGKVLKKNATLATYNRAPLQEMMFLARLLRKNGHKPDKPHEFFRIKSYETPSEAVDAVRSGDADYVVTSGVVYIHVISNRPNRAKLKRLDFSKPIPEPVVIGKPEIIKRLRPGGDLWREVQEQLRTIHRTAAGQECASFWYVTEFALPKEQNLNRLIKSRLEEYPFTAFQELTKHRDPAK